MGKIVSHAHQRVHETQRIRALLDAIDQCLSDHDSRNRASYYSLMGSITRPAFNSAEGGFVCECRFGGKLHRIVVQVDEYHGGAYNETSVTPTCTCPLGSGGNLCIHTYAGLSRVKFELFSTTNPLRQAYLANQRVPPWQVAIRELDRFLTSSDVPAVPAATVTGPATRLVWRLRLSDDEVAIFPCEQSRSKKGLWRRGRRVSWDHVRRHQDLLATEADRKVFAAYCKEQYSSWDDAPMNGNRAFDALPHLAGTLQLFADDDPTEPLDVRQGHAGMSVDNVKEGLKLAIAIEGEPADKFEHLCIVPGRGLVALDQPRRLLLVCPAQAQFCKLAQSLLHDSVVVPADGREQLLSRLPAIEARLPVALPAEMQGEAVAADARLFLRLQPIEPAGMLAELRVRPIADSDFRLPGEGAEEIAGLQAGHRVRYVRNLSDELERAQALEELLFLSRFPTERRFTWKLESNDDSLDLLDVLRARPEGDPVVVWAEGSQARRMSVVGEITPGSLKVEISEQHDWFGLKGTIEIGGQKFPLAELLQSLRLGQRYVKVAEGQWASIAKEFRDRLSAIGDMLHKNHGKLEFNATAAPVLADLLDDQVILKACRAWTATLDRLARASDLDPQVPVALTAELRDYQVDGYKWLRRLAEWGVGGCLADDMGLGKTVQTLAVLIDRMDKGPTLVAAPVSVGFNWVRETNRFAPTLQPILYRDTDRVDFLQTLKAGDVLITSYYLLVRHAEELSQIEWGTVVLDEAQAVKNAATKTAQAVRQLKADWRIALTGTPMENHLGELWAVFRAVTPGLFGSQERFKELFSDPIEKERSVDRKHALSRTVRPFILRRTKSEVLSELPSRTEVLLTAELSDAERRLYEDARLWAVANLSNLTENPDQDQRFQVLAAITKLRQLACHPKLIDAEWTGSSAKLDLFLETVDELREGRHRALVFSQFTKHLALIRAALDERGIKYQYLDGDTPARQRQDRVDAFQHGDGDLFLISLKAGGLGLNLTAADYVIHLDPWWNPAVEDQATDRAHRIGQTRPVMVYRLVAKDTIEEKILALHAEKRNLVSGVLDGTNAAAKLSTKELIDLIRTAGR